MGAAAALEGRTSCETVSVRDEIQTAFPSIHSRSSGDRWEIAGLSSETSACVRSCVCINYFDDENHDIKVQHLLDNLIGPNSAVLGIVIRASCLKRL